MMKIIIFIFKWDPDTRIPRLSDEIIILIFKLMMRIIILMSQAARLCKTGSGGGLGISLEGTVDVEEGVEVGGHFL